MNFHERFRKESYAGFTHKQNQTFGRSPAIAFALAALKLQQGEIVSWSIDPNNQQNVRPGNTRVSLVDSAGGKYEVEARYNPTTQQIYPPL